MRFYESGEDEDRAVYDIAWVADKDSPVDTVNGFIENYLDARGVKGAWEGIVSVVNHEKTEGLHRLAEAAAWFEARMPWDPQWRRTEVVGVTARAIDVIVETGDAGPLTAIGINLPNDQRIRERYGSKSVTLANINEAYDKAQVPAYRSEFCWDADEIARAERFGARRERGDHGDPRGARARLGPGGRPPRGAAATGTEGDVLVDRGSRADLVALYFVPDPKVAEVGLLPAGHQDAIVQNGIRGVRTQCPGPVAPRARGIDPRRGPHAQPPADRLLVARAYPGHRRPGARRAHVLRARRTSRRSRRAPAGCWPRSSGSSPRATTPQREPWWTPTAPTSNRRCATRSSRVSIG